jgi:hypothetical protein
MTKQLFSLSPKALIGLVALLSMPSANAVNLTTNGIGELAMVPYYTVRDGWQTVVSLNNTGADPILVKLRVKEGWNGREALNFTIALAGYDAFAGVIREGSQGPVFVASDQADGQGRRSCTVPNAVAEPGVATPLSTAAFGPPGSENDDGGPSGDGPDAIDRLREGRVELYVLGYAEGSDLGSGGGSLMAIGDAIESHNCQVLASALSNATTNGERNTLIAARQFGEPVNVLQAQFSLLNAQRGVEAGMPATTWANFYKRDAEPDTAMITPEENAGCQLARDFNSGGQNSWYPDGSFGSCRNLVTAQEFPNHLEPDLNDAYPAIAHWWNDDGDWAEHAQPDWVRTRALRSPGGVSPPTTPSIQLPRGVDALSLTVQRSQIMNSWSTNPALGVTTDWVVSFPTKAFYVDDGTGTGHQGPGDYSALNPRRDSLYSAAPEQPIPPFTASFGQSTEEDRSSAGACEFGRGFLHDRAALKATGSPFGPEVSLALCAETNIIGFGNGSALPAAHASNVDSAAIPELLRNAGWMRLTFDGQLRAEQVGGPFVGTVHDHIGLPVIGFALRQRTFGGVTRNFASLSEHGYERARTAVAD